MRYIVLMMPGIADEPLEALDGNTPLQVAETVYLDRLASEGLSGRVQLIPEGLRPAEELSAFAMLGYDPAKEYPGRGAVEASMLNFERKEDEAVLACRLVTAVDGKMVDPSSGNITRKEGCALLEGLNRFFAGRGVRFVPGRRDVHVVLIGPPSPSDGLERLALFPPEECVGKKWGSVLPKGKARSFIKRVLQEASEFLENHDVNKVRIDLGENPANLIWVWGAAKVVDIDPFEKRFGKSAAALSSSAAFLNIAKTVGIEGQLVDEGENAEPVAVQRAAELILKASKASEVVFVYLPQADAASRQGDYKKKVRWIEAFDRQVLGTLTEKRGKECRILVSSNHVTSSKDRIQSASPAPFVLSDRAAGQGGRTVFSEEFASKSGYQPAGGEALLRELFKQKGIKAKA